MSDRGVSEQEGVRCKLYNAIRTQVLKTIFPSRPLCVSECECHLMPGGQKQLNLHREVALSIKDLLLGLNH